MVVARGVAGRGKDRDLLFNWFMVSVLQNKKVLEIGCTAM